MMSLTAPQSDTLGVTNFSVTHCVINSQKVSPTFFTNSNFTNAPRLSIWFVFLKNSVINFNFKILESRVKDILIINPIWLSYPWASWDRQQPGNPWAKISNLSVSKIHKHNPDRLIQSQQHGHVPKSVWVRTGSETRNWVKTQDWV